MTLVLSPFPVLFLSPKTNFWGQGIRYIISFVICLNTLVS